MTSEGSSGTRHTGRQVLGKTEELGEHVYKIGSSDQADTFVRTTEAIADYVGVTYGWAMRVLVKNRKEKVFLVASGGVLSRALAAFLLLGCDKIERISDGGRRLLVRLTRKFSLG
jgi:hypothetical protein